MPPSINDAFPLLHRYTGIDHLQGSYQVLADSIFGAREFSACDFINAAMCIEQQPANWREPMYVGGEYETRLLQKASRSFPVTQITVFDDGRLRADA